MHRVKRWSVGVVALLATSGAAMATPSVPAMPAIAFPITTASIVTAVVAAGALLLLAYFGPKVGFSFVKRSLNRLHKSV